MALMRAEITDRMLHVTTMLFVTVRLVNREKKTLMNGTLYTSINAVDSINNQVYTAKSVYIDQML